MHVCFPFDFLEGRVLQSLGVPVGGLDAGQALIARDLNGREGETFRAYVLSSWFVI